MNDQLTISKTRVLGNDEDFQFLRAEGLKYIENLANKIIKGGKGLWGSAAMTPHPNLPEAQAEEMARYILSLRNAADTTK